VCIFTESKYEKEAVECEKFSYDCLTRQVNEMRIAINKFSTAERRKKFFQTRKMRVGARLKM
jgi:hypothetical protein